SGGPDSGWAEGRQGATIFVGSVVGNMFVCGAPRAGNLGQRCGRGPRDALGIRLGTWPVRIDGHTWPGSVCRAGKERSARATCADRKSFVERPQEFLSIGEGDYNCF